MSDRPTPETDALWQQLCSSGQSWYRIAECVCDRARHLERERDEAREAFAVVTDQLVQAQSALREIHTIVQLRFAEWSPANDVNTGSEEAAR